MQSTMAATAATEAPSATSLLCVPHFAHPIHKDHKWVGTGTPHSGGSMGGVAWMVEKHEESHGVGRGAEQDLCEGL